MGVVAFLVSDVVLGRGVEVDGLTSGCFADPPYAVGYSSSWGWALTSSMACLTQLIVDLLFWTRLAVGG